MQGICPRYIQDKISNALVSHQAQLEKAINPFMVMNELEERPEPPLADHR